MPNWESFDNRIKNSLSFLDNEYVNAALYLFLILYAGLAAPQLPSYIAKLFDYTLFKIFLFFLIVYVSRKNPTVAIIAAVAVMVSLMTLNKIKFGNELMAVVRGEVDGTVGPYNCTCEDCPCKNNRAQGETDYVPFVRGNDNYEHNNGNSNANNCDGGMCDISDRDVHGINEYGHYGPHEYQQYVPHARGSTQHEVENMLRRSEETRGIEERPQVSTLQEQSTKGVSVDAHELVRSEREEESVQSVSMEQLAEEVRSRIKGSASAEEIKALCAEVAHEYRNNVNRNFTRSEYNAQGFMNGLDSRAGLYASAN